jgi:hypothetical protein
VGKPDLFCRHCGIQWPGDDAITLVDLARRATPNLPVCINRATVWFVDSGINGHVFDVTKEARRG